MKQELLSGIIYCPQCQNELTTNQELIRCPGCQKEYPVIKNIPVFKNINLEKYKSLDLDNTPKDNPFQYALHFWFYKKYLKKYLRPRADDLILDIGCGIGHCLGFLGKFSKKLVGLEIDLPALLYAQKTTEADYVLAGGEKLPFKDNTFDKLVSLVVLEHIEDDKNAVKEMWRVGKNKAKVLVIVPALEGPRLHTKEKQAMHKDGVDGEKHYRDGYNKEGIKKLLNENSIKVIKIRHTMFLFSELFMELTRKLYSRKHKTYKNQTDWFKVTNSKLFSLYKIFAPIIGNLALLEDWLFSWSKKGHMIVVKGEIEK